jgi:hypothetical protein
MKHVAILALNDAVSASVADPTVMFNGVNDLLVGLGRPPAFKVQLVGLTEAAQWPLHSPFRYPDGRFKENGFNHHHSAGWRYQ